MLVLGIAPGWGQVKLWLTLLVAWTSWPAWVQWGVGTALAVIITWGCFWSTEWAVRKWGPQPVVTTWQTGFMDLGHADLAKVREIKIDLVPLADAVLHPERHGGKK